MTTDTLTPTAAAFLGAFDEAAFTRAANPAEPALLRAKREEAFGQYRALPVPTVREEEWRRTDPALFDFSAVRCLPALATVPAGEAGELDASFDVVVTVGDAGYSITRRSEAPVDVLTFAEAAVKMPDVLRAHLQGPASPAKPRKFTAFIDAFWNFGLLIHVQPGAKVSGGVLVRYEHGTAGTLIAPRLLIVAGADSELTVAEYYRSADGVRLLCASSREMYVGDRANLKLVALQEWGNASLHLGEDWSRVGEGAKIDWVTLALGSQVSKQMCGCDVTGRDAKAYLSGLYFATDGQHIDLKTLQKHSSPDTYSNLLYKGAVKDRAHSVYQGIIAAGRGAIRVDAYQMNNNLILSGSARADSLPGLEIDADDLKCSHGSTMGTLDPDQMFYLQSRGFSKAEARRTLVNAFFEDVIGRVPYPFMQERIRAHVAQKVD